MYHMASSLFKYFGYIIQNKGYLEGVVNQSNMVQER